MKTKSLMIALTAVALLTVSLPAAHAYANLFSAPMHAGQWQSKSLSLSSDPHALTRVRVDIHCMTLAYPPGDFDIYLYDQWGRRVAVSNGPGADSIDTWVRGTRCTLRIHCARFHGTYQCSVAVENSPHAP